VDLRDRDRPGDGVQVVDVLGDRVLEHANPLQLSHGKVAVVGHGLT
jgi:hypothetical protein